MDGAAWAADMFSGLPYFNPSMFINLSGLCASTKLIQCREMGVYQCDVSRKFEQNPSDVVDLQRADFLARKKVVDAVEKWVESKEKGEKRVMEEWLPILYDYELVKGSAKRLKDRGHLIFTDMTTTRFLSVMCFGDNTSSCEHNMSFEEDYASITKANAQRFFSLAKYLYHGKGEPKFVRATYTTLQLGLHPEFLASVDKAPTSTDVPVFHISEDNFVPSLQVGEVERIDSLLASFKKKPPPAEVKELVTGTKSARPAVDTWLLGNVKNPNVCAHCGDQGQKAMSTCARCKLVRYCGKDCQKAAWRIHKRVCKAPSARMKALCA
ncbi:hypothetical protein EUX98_g4319 [Antrodiella citrinella]|uniref:MYND-type domain-containing protein n=1 Tax=Antrodiella citrinella TaxID=2447956 RepID=A0A4S4MWT7_9APHY|nr:hypothetical protein EUX98_g4319 [Antrodiella citrinella]